MDPEPTIEDVMTASGYVRCGGCGGYLPAGAICGYCLQQQQQKMAPPQPVRPRTKPRPVRTAIVLGICAIAVCGVGLAAVFAVKNVGKLSNLAGKAGSSSLAGLGTAEEDGAASLSSKAGDPVIAALNSGNTQQALSALQASGPPAPSTMAATAQAGQAPAMQSEPASTAPTMQIAKGMPDNVRNWLEHLHKTEEARVALAAEQLKESVKTLANLKADDLNHAMDDGSDDSQAADKARENQRAGRVSGDMATMQQAWKTLLSAFDAVPAPAECVGIKANYDQVVGQTGTMILEIVAKIKSASTDPQGALSALTAMQGTSKAKIDVPAHAADSGVADVCKRYDTTKWFDIQSDVGSGVMGQIGL